MDATLEAQGGALKEGLKAEIVVGIPSYNNGRTIAHVVMAVDAGLKKYFPDLSAVIINSDGGSRDDTAQKVIASPVDHKAYLITHPVRPVNRITTPYHGIPGKGSAFRNIFDLAVKAGARACCVVDADLRSITPEWIELLIAPVLKEGFDFVAPLYARHKYDGTITNSIIYPVTRALYGKRIRQPIGGDFGFSGEMARFYLSQDVWSGDVARYGIDIWMTTEALAGRFKVCQSYLGAKIHDPKDPGTDLSDMFIQVAGSLFHLTEKHSSEWRETTGSREVPTFGFRFEAGVVPVTADVERLLRRFRVGVENLGEVWERILSPETMRAVMKVSEEESKDFRLPDEIWVRIVYEFMLAHRKRRLAPDHLLKSLIPLYYGRTASFFLEMADASDNAAEERVEDLCVEYENQKNYLVSHW